jgi:hypothetical protein
MVGLCRVGMETFSHIHRNNVLKFTALMVGKEERLSAHPLLIVC